MAVANVINHSTWNVRDRLIFLSSAWIHITFFVCVCVCLCRKLISIMEEIKRMVELELWQTDLTGKIAFEQVSWKWQICRLWCWASQAGERWLIAALSHGLRIIQGPIEEPILDERMGPGPVLYLVCFLVCWDWVSCVSAWLTLNSSSPTSTSSAPPA